MKGVSDRLWPERLWIIRHGESAGNVARDAAHAAGAERIDLSVRDVDVELSPAGREQAAALGRWFAGAAAADRPDALLASPYARARTTAQLFREAGGAATDDPVRVDERLREKEFGVLDGLTAAGIRAHYPEQAEFRRLLGKFYHRPPGGESWCDVIFRLRSVADALAVHYAGRRVMIVAHQVVVLCLRYVLEDMTEKQILAIDGQGDVANCSVTEYRRGDDADPGRAPMALVRYNETAPVAAGRAPVTAEPPASGRSET